MKKIILGSSDYKKNAREKNRTSNIVLVLEILSAKRKESIIGISEDVNRVMKP